MEQRMRDSDARRVWALQAGLAIGLLVLAGLSARSTAPSVQWPVLVLVLVGSQLVERCRRTTGAPGMVATPDGMVRAGVLRRIRGWLQRQISDGVVHGHEEGERCDDLCRRAGAPDGPRPTHAPAPAPTRSPVPPQQRTAAD